MKLRNIIYSLSLLVGVLTLGSCVNDDDVCLPEGKTQVIFSLVLQDNVQGTTRAGDETWNNYTPKEDGVEYDNYIDLDGLQVLVFASDGTFKGTLKDLVYTPKDVTSDNYEYTRYEYVGTAPSEITAGDYKFVVLANCATVEPSNLTSLNELTYKLFEESGNTEYIPMWGINKATLSLVAGARQNIGTIGLLRAMAKVNVKLTSEALSEKYIIKEVKVTRYNKSGYTLPTGADTAEKTEDLNLDASIRVNSSLAENKTFTAPAGATELTFYLTEYDNWTTSDTDARLVVTLGKSDDATYENVFSDYPIQFRDYVKEGDNAGTIDANGKRYNIIRNHIYQFNIFRVTDDGPLYVVPTVAPWTDGPKLEYTIDASTNMRLFDSWLYRYDTDGDVTPSNYTEWATSHMMVSSNVDATSSPANRPMQSPQIQLVTSGSSTFELYVDNSDFEIVRANKNDVGVVTSYDCSTDGTLTIAAGKDVYTYFYIMPKSSASAGSTAKVFLYYNDPVLGKQKMTYNYNSLPGYSDDSSEIWVYYVAPDNYKYSEGTVLKMYYQDVNHPLVPTPVQN